MQPILRASCLAIALFQTWSASAATSASRELLPVSAPGVTVWWAISGAAKIQPDLAPPSETGTSIKLFSAKNERDAAQLVISSTRALSDFRISCDSLIGSSGTFSAANLEILQVQYLNLTRASDGGSRAGWWPDPLLPLEGSLELGAGSNHVFWLRVAVPKNAASGNYSGKLKLKAKDFAAEVPLELVVFDFELPDRMSCTTAFGFSPGEVFRYHGVKTEQDKRLVLDKYLSNLSAHHVSPYDPAPLDGIKVTWPQVQPPRTLWDDWSGLRIVTNEVHSGRGALLVYDDQPSLNTTTTFEPLIPIPSKGLRFRGWFRTAVPGQRFIVTFNHFDSTKQWMSGRNNDMALAGTGQWQPIDETLTNFPSSAAYVKLNLRATTWTDKGENLGLVWFDDLSLRENGETQELLPGGDFERKPRTELAVAAEKLRPAFDFGNWDRAMERAMDTYHFTSFQVHYPGLGGGTFHAIDGPSLLGFGENDPEYPLLMASYGQQLETHLRERGWLDRSFAYWFDEPNPDQYPFVMNGFAKLKRYSPGIARMLTEQVEPGLIGGPNLWCPISNEYNHERAEERRRAGDKFWWYVCTGPKAPYAGLFIDHPAPEMRVWVWQTWQRGITGLLVWQINYWTSEAAYPDKAQNPYEDPMSWTSGYSTPAGQKLPWGNGDGRFIYPPLAAAEGAPGSPVLAGPVDSIRWEHMRDGIEDYEYFSMLRDRLETARPRLSVQEAAEFSNLLKVPSEVTSSMTEFTKDGSPIEAHRLALARAIERLKGR